jgi:hypothetical protein
MSTSIPASLIARILDKAAAALAGRPGSTQQQRDARARDAAEIMREFAPRNVIEAMLAAHCVLFHQLIDDALETVANQNQVLPSNAGVPAGVIALNNAFHRNLACFQRARKIRPEEEKPPVGPEIAITADPATATAPTTTAPTEVPLAVSKPAVSTQPEARRPNSAPPTTTFALKQPPQASAGPRSEGLPPARVAASSQIAAKIAMAGGVRPASSPSR